jgi:hypothetical protein
VLPIQHQLTNILIENTNKIMKSFEYELKIKAESESEAEVKLKAIINILNKLTKDELCKVAEVVSNPFQLSMIKQKLIK